MPLNKNIKGIEDRYVDNDEIKKQIDDAIKIIDMILKNVSIGIKMKKKVIDSMLWNISGASEKSNGKYLIRYRSEESMGNKNASLIHEHVFQKKYLIDEIIEKNILTKEIIEKIVGCVVTDKEHKELHKKKYNNLIGWERYEKANIKVIDKLNNQPFIFPKN